METVELTCCQSKRTRTLALVVALWDLGWKAAAIRRARQVGKSKWIIPLALLNTVGLLPIWFLRRHPVDQSSYSG